MTQRTDDGIWMALADKVKLPIQVQRCLFASGYDNVNAVSSIEDIKTIENFFRTKYKLFTSASQLSTFYGIYASAPQEFEFLPGHMEPLKSFIQLCKKICKVRGNKKHKDKFALADKKKLIYSDSNGSSTSASDSYPSLKCKPYNYSSPRLYNPPFRRNASKSRTSPMILYLSSDPLISPITDSLQRSIYHDIKNKLRRWCVNQEISDLQILENETHYKILVQPKLPKESETSTTEYQSDYDKYTVSMLCFMCGANIRLFVRKTSYTISNATRHLTRCIKSNMIHEKAQPITSSVSSDVGDLSTPSKVKTSSEQSSFDEVMEESVCVTVDSDVSVHDPILNSSKGSGNGSDKEDTLSKHDS